MVRVTRTLGTEQQAWLEAASHSISEGDSFLLLLWPALPYKPVSLGICNLIRASQTRQAAGPGSRCGGGGDVIGRNIHTYTVAASSRQVARENIVRNCRGRKGSLAQALMPWQGRDRFWSRLNQLVTLSSVLSKEKRTEHTHTEQPKACPPSSFHTWQERGLGAHQSKDFFLSLSLLKLKAPGYTFNSNICLIFQFNCCLQNPG